MPGRRAYRAASKTFNKIHRIFGSMASLQHRACELPFQFVARARVQMSKLNIMRQVKGNIYDSTHAIEK